ncbi:V-type immunoglobulin domain-containing suppressor of T-cell activation [Mastacembelus armatus]|nr:V-type immunoglobulin domain-containing suppressor of T-cell activation [Mastacembelus armatus]
MEGGLPFWGKKFAFWFCSVLFLISGVKGEMSHVQYTMSVTAPYLHYTCPEGATVKLVCDQKGAILHHDDILKHIWLFTPHSDQHCTVRQGPRHMTGHPQGDQMPGLKFGHTDHNFWVTLKNVTYADQGRYCCIAADFQMEHKHGYVMQRPHSHVILHITPRRNGSQDCTVWDPAPSGSSVPVALAIAACILALFSLPLILVLVYKQRQSAQTSRRAQELVRMDSGHENPVFLGESPQIKTRTVSQIMTRQASETGRHLLSEPGTPLSPPAHGDVFFPIEDTIPESPEFLQV